MSGYSSNTSTYEDVRNYIESSQYNMVVEGDSQTSFYNIVKVLSSIIVLVFLTLLICSLLSIAPFNWWSIGLVGLLGSVGLSGSIWLSKNIFNK
jgi:hypothetical protein